MRFEIATLLLFAGLLGVDASATTASTASSAATSTTNNLGLLRKLNPGRILQEDEEEDQQEEENYEEVESGYVSKAQCRSFTVEQGNEELESILSWSGSKLFRVAQRSYVFYNYNNNENDDEAASNMMTDLESWTYSMAAVKGSGQPACTEIPNAQQLFSRNSRVVHSYFAIDIDQYMADTGTNQVSWAPALYEGAICGMGSDKNSIEIGVFLDDTCTTLAPKLMYEYRNFVENGSVNATQPEAIEMASTETKKTLSCKKYDICSRLLGSSVDADYCEGNNEEDNEEERNEDNEQDNQDQGQADDQADDQEENYQIDQDDLYDLEAACYAAVTSLSMGNTLESYLIQNQQLRVTNPKAIQSTKIMILVMLIVGLLITVASTVRIRKKKRANIDVSNRDDGSASNDDESATTFTIDEENAKTSLFAVILGPDESLCSDDSTFASGSANSSGSSTGGGSAGTDSVGTGSASGGGSGRWKNPFRKPDDKEKPLVSDEAEPGTETEGGSKGGSKGGSRRWRNLFRRPTTK